MKKIITILAAAFCLFSGMMFTGCDEDSPLNELVGPVNTWCYRRVEYKSNPSKSVDVYCYYATQDKDDIVMGYSSSGEENKAKVTLKKGLNIVITGDENETSDILNTTTNKKIPFYLKSFVEGESELKIAGNEDGTGEKSFTVKKTLWNLLYLSAGWDSYSDKTFPLSKSYQNYESVQELKNGFKLSIILRKLAASKLEQILLAGIDDQQ